MVQVGYKHGANQPPRRLPITCWGCGRRPIARSFVLLLGYVLNETAGRALASSAFETTSGPIGELSCNRCLMQLWGHAFTQRVHCLNPLSSRQRIERREARDRAKFPRARCSVRRGDLRISIERKENLGQMILGGQYQI